MKLILCDLDEAVVGAWRLQFNELPQVEIRHGSALDAEAHALLVPGNSFGFMDGGLALRVAERCGYELEEAVRGRVLQSEAKELLVGQAEVFATGKSPRWIVYAPTMRTPQSVRDTVNAYLAARAAFLAVRRFNESSGPIQSLVLPGLCTGEGKLEPLIAARQIRYAFEEFSGLRKLPSGNLSKIARREKKLKTMPLAGREEGEE